MTEEQVEQITKIPDLNAEQKTPKAKEKDPKRVKAGKKLAENNKKAREALKRETDRETNQPEVVSEKSYWFPELSFDRVLTLIGIGLAAWNIFGKTQGTFQVFKRPPERSYVNEQKDPPPVSPQPTPKAPPTRPLMGMD